MKKLLGLLGAITIAGSVLPTVMAVSPYPAEQKTKKHLKKIIETNNEVYSIAVDNKNNIYFGTTDGLYKSSDNGENISKISNLSNVYYLIADKKNNIFFGNNSSNFYILENGSDSPKQTAWSQQFNSFAIDSKNNIYFATNMGVNILENEATILKNTNIYGQIFSLSIDNENNIYFGKNDGLYKSIDNGQTSIKINNIPSYSVYSLSIDKQNNIYIGTSVYTYLLEQKTNKVKRIDRLGSSEYIVCDENNNIFFIKNNKLYILKQKQIIRRIPTVKKIDELEYNNIKSITTNNIYMYVGSNNGIYKLI